MSDAPRDMKDVHRQADELAAEWSRSEWKHFKGGLYTVLDVVVDEATGDLLVIYLSQLHQTRWSRPLRVWQERVNPTTENPDGVLRFQPL